MDTAAPDGRPPPAPEAGGRAVPGAWTGYNGHMTGACYSLAFTEAAEALVDHLGLGAAPRR